MEKGHHANDPPKEFRVDGGPVEFSFWPTRKVSSRYVSRPRIFSSSPWNIIESVVNDKCPDATKAQALSFLQQSKDFFSAGHFGNIRAAKPLLIYYSFMNLVKTFALVREIVDGDAGFYHGLKAINSESESIYDQKFEAFPINAAKKGDGKKNLFSVLLKGLTGEGLKKSTDYDLSKDLIPQILLGHRLWCVISGEEQKKERFIEVGNDSNWGDERVQFYFNKKEKNSWIRFVLDESNLSRAGYTREEIKNNPSLLAQWCIDDPSLQGNLMFRMIHPIGYEDGPLETFNDLARSVRHQFWCSVTIVRPFRKYYIYISEEDDSKLLPQLCSIYAVFFYLGSITRYRPYVFDEIDRGPYGAFFREFIQNQPNQWLYLMASEFAEQDIAKAAVV